MAQVSSAQRYRRRRAWWLALLLAIVPITSLASDAGIRIGLLFNFIKFAEWPVTALEQDDAPLNVCIVKGDPAMSAGVAVLGTYRVQGHPLQPRVISQPDEAAGCHVLYLPARERGQADAFLDAAHEATLTVSDARDFVDMGGMIGLVLQDNRYVFEINNEQLRHAQLRLNPQVLRLAQRVL